jgi:hypothetical protein
MEGTHNEETEGIQEGDEEFEADQGHRETCEGNESGYPICTSRKFVSYPQQGGSCAHR